MASTSGKKAKVSQTGGGGGAKVLSSCLPDAGFLPLELQWTFIPKAIPGRIHKLEKGLVFTKNNATLKENHPFVLVYVLFIGIPFSH